MAQLDSIRLSGTTYELIDATAIHSLDGYYTTGETNAVITAATDALAQAIAEQGYQTSGDVQNAISGKADADSVYTKQETSNLINQSVSGYADSVQYNSTTKYVEFYHGTTAGTKVYEFDASPFLIDGMVESVVITSITSGGSEVTVLEITWNSAAGGQVTDIPLSEIFDASNYYTKSEVNTALANKADLSAATVSVEDSGSSAGTIYSQTITIPFDYSYGVYQFDGSTTGLWTSVNPEEFYIKVNKGSTERIITQSDSGMTPSVCTLTINTEDNAFTISGIKGYKVTEVHIKFSDGEHNFTYGYRYSGTLNVPVSTYIENTMNPRISTLESGKQDTLVSGTNIKTINGSSVLGSGDLTVDTGLHAEVSGSTLIFS